MSRQEFLASANLAEYLGLAPVESLHLPVPLNVILLGFAGDGNGGVNISLPELNDWFEHLDHILPHTRIDRAELTCQEDGQCAGLVHGRFHPTPMPSHVHLNFSCNVVRVARRSVVDAFERAIAAFSRPVDPAVATGVDAAKMEALVDHFVGALGLESSYSLVVLNPTWHVDEPVYGYRMGRAYPRLASSCGSERWVGTVTSYLSAEEVHRRGLLAAAGSDRGAAAMVQAARLLARPGSTMGSILRKDLFEAWAEASEALHSTFHASHPAEDCLVNTWVGSAGRWALLDLTAGGKDWGPALGGEGVVHHSSLPNVHELFSGTQRLKERARQEAASAGTHESAVTEALAQARSARLPSVANRHHHAFLLKRQRRMAMAAPGAPPLDAASKEAEEEEERQWRLQHQMVLLQAELDVLEEWALRYCHNQPNPPLACGTWRDEVMALRSGLAKLHGSSNAEAVYELFRDHRWEIFGQEPDLAEWQPELFDEAEIATDTLLGELAGALSRAIRHVIAPPTAAWAARPLAAPPAGQHSVHGSALAAQHGPRHTTAPPFAYQVNFHIYVISDTSRHLRNIAGASRIAAFDVDAYKAAVDTLRLSNQGFKFEVTRVSLLDDPALASGLAAATRTTLQEVPSSEDFFDAEMERVYIDSRELADTLRKQFPPTRQQLQREVAAAGRPGHIRLTAQTRELPVYVLQLEREHAVLLDEHYNARALEDMILVVANAARRDEHPTGMMCGGSLVARPVSPLKEALAATLLALGGVLPPHLGYHPRSGVVSHDWLWSVGAHPLSFTSTGLRYTAVQRDALARAYLLDALDSSVEAVNAAIRRLTAAKTSTVLHKHIKARVHTTGARDLLRKFADVINGWRSAANVAYSLDYTTAFEYVKTIEGDINSLAILAHTVAELAEPARCSASVVDSMGALLPLSYLGSAALVLCALLYAVAPRLSLRKTKAM
ncbi:hypothetical protein GPECTOR_2g1222 [Gonium pectorale]|uniref:DUF7906 domain-containing protein n=1 Tax=Gonium pectorale TaxID=33097 RepID=A0A150H117_GONPE|nr:hypothetical protein GPECTOR_2g1222 [Gonium pectorale]|eukprot:KXZ55672.1 hypothetical protein GPECTOR_2g1222 [Gonium pectorale]